MRKHTPGPWKVYSAPLRPNFPTPIIEIQDANDQAVVPWPGLDAADQPKGVKLANAHLISAAPEMLAALKLPAVLYALGYVAEFAGDGGDHTQADGRKADAAIKAIRAAIAKARGLPDISDRLK